MTSLQIIGDTSGAMLQQTGSHNAPKAKADRPRTTQPAGQSNHESSARATQNDQSAALGSRATSKAPAAADGVSQAEVGMVADGTVALELSPSADGLFAQMVRRLTDDSGQADAPDPAASPIANSPLPVNAPAALPADNLPQHGILPANTQPVESQVLTLQTSPAQTNILAPQEVREPVSPNLQQVQAATAANSQASAQPTGPPLDAVQPEHVAPTMPAAPSQPAASQQALAQAPDSPNLTAEAPADNTSAPQAATSVPVPVATRLASRTVVSPAQEGADNSDHTAVATDEATLTPRLQAGQASGQTVPQAGPGFEMPADISNLVHGPGAEADTSAQNISSVSGTSAAATPGQVTAESLVSVSAADQIAHSLRLSADQGRQRVVIRLDPPELGSVRLTLQHHREGLRGIVEVDNQRTLTELQHATPPLLQRLADAGIQVRRLDLTLDSNAGQNAGGSDSGLRDSSFAQGQGQHESAASSDGRGAATMLTGTDDTDDASIASHVSDNSINVWI